MKKNKGITMIALIITIIVVVLIASITISNGLNTLDTVRKKNIDDTANAICAALLVDDSFLEFSEPSGDLLEEDDFEYMNLKKLFDEKTKVYVTKSTTGEADHFTTTYELIVEDTKKNKEYSYSYDYTYTNEKYNYSVVFDTRNEVNMPIVLEGMTALTPSGDEVQNIYNEMWYSYKKGFSHFAKMRYEGETYTWIPRYAYKIQDFYNGKNYTNIPSSAIDIVFLRENTNYMYNGEVLPDDYIVHSAFSKNGIDYPGMWVKQEDYDTASNVNSAQVFIEKDNLNIHTMTNEECGACLYLSYAFEDMNDVLFEDDEYVAAEYGTARTFNEDNVTIYDDVLLGGTIGDATSETPWGRTSGDDSTADKPYIIRKFSQGMFDYTNSDGNDSAKFRNVIKVAGVDGATNMPTGYKIVDYIESHGTEYIDTKFWPNKDTKVDFLVDVTYPTTTNTYAGICGGRTALIKTGEHTGDQVSSYNVWILKGGLGNAVRSDYGTVPGNPTIESSTSLHIIKDKGDTYVNDELIQSIPYADFKSEGKLGIFTIITNVASDLTDSKGADNRRVSAKLYYFKVYDNGTLIRDMIPCYRRSDNKPGLFDKINNVFYTNAGTGEFTFED